MEVETIEVGDGVWFPGGFGLPDCHVGEHVPNS
jgi:hypothetical protein